MGRRQPPEPSRAGGLPCHCPTPIIRKQGQAEQMQVCFSFFFFFLREEELSSTGPLREERHGVACPAAIVGFRVGIGWRPRSTCAAAAGVQLWSLHTFIGRSHARGLTRNLQQHSRAERNTCSALPHTCKNVKKNHKPLKQRVQPEICYGTIPRAAKNMSHQEQIFRARKCQPVRPSPHLASSTTQLHDHRTNTGVGRHT